MPNAGNSNESADEETRDEAARTITNQSTAHYGIVVGLSLGDGRVMVAFITRLSNDCQTTIIAIRTTQLAVHKPFRHTPDLTDIPYPDSFGTCHRNPDHPHTSAPNENASDSTCPSTLRN